MSVQGSTSDNHHPELPSRPDMGANQAPPDTNNREKERFAALLEISTHLSSILNLPRLLDFILQATNKLTDAVASSILLLDQETGTLHFEATSNIPQSQMGRIEVPLEGSVAGWVIANSQPRIIQQIRNESEFTASAMIDSLTAFSTQSLLAVPLSVKGKVIGVLEALNKRRGEPFTEDDVETLMVLAGQAAVAIENARLFQQSDLISEMVHEIRTPMMALVAMSELLTRPDLDIGRRDEMARTIQREAKRLTDMMNSFLDLSHLESGRAQLRHEPFQVADLVRETIAVQSQQAAQNNIAIHVSIPDRLPALIADRHRLKQVLLNLVSNAIKYNRAGGEIRISADASAQHLTILVADTGRGIPAESLKQLFVRFYRVPDSEGFVTGTGLGLSISKRIIQQHGGSIWVDSEHGKGSCFGFSLPLRPNPRANEEIPSATGVRSQSAP